MTTPYRSPAVVPLHPCEQCRKHPCEPGTTKCLACWRALADALRRVREIRAEVDTCVHNALRGLDAIVAVLDEQLLEDAPRGVK